MVLPKTHGAWRALQEEIQLPPQIENDRPSPPQKLVIAKQTLDHYGGYEETVNRGGWGAEVE